jgi:hypothetical protein
MSLMVVRTTLPRVTPLQAQALHQPLDRAAGHHDALAVQSASRPCRRRRPAVGVPDALDLGIRALVTLARAQRSCGLRCWAAWRQ